MSDQMQLSLKLTPSNPHSLNYFVPHSGVAYALEQLRSAIRLLIKKPELFFIFSLFGPKGSGKTHLAQSVFQEGIELGLLPNQLLLFEPDGAPVESGAELSEYLISSFVSCFEEKKRKGGVIVFSSRECPDNLTTNPHLLSRLKSGDILSLSYPQEEELYPLLLSLAERNNLRLSEKSLQYLLRRLPQEPLSFENIFARISELSFSQSKSAGFTVVRSALSKG